ncbi:ABC transporter ATP-binding protein [Brevibacterium zhoupengii]|uniref:ABC transporter ATP-binding protein n=1 Tax=Brevibacterium zhoupengii TaxID=2898795 RepID=UPI001E34E341|nr:ABC transporter ATP-binding protein [Brevibacterium zhoupengii]
MVTNSSYLSIRNLQKQYPKTSTPAVDDVCLDVLEGELIALLGPSGCGKTTTLRMVAGLLDPSDGEIHVNGRDVVAVPVHKRGMGMVFQSYALFPHMNIAENVAFGLQMQKLPRGDVNRKALEALEMVQLSHLKDRRPAELSGGQQQRVALARALAIEPTLLLLDEPLSNLDAKLREAMRHEIRSIQQRLGTTTLFVTHDQDEALDMADRIAILNNGRIEQYAPPNVIYDQPATRFVANFVGKANFLDAEHVMPLGGDQYRVQTREFGELDVRGTATLDLTHASLVIRPHRMFMQSVNEAAHMSGPSTVGEVITTSYTGNVQSYEVRIDVDTILRVDELTDATTTLSTGDRVYLSFDAGEAYLVSESGGADHDVDTNGQ